MYGSRTRIIMDAAGNAVQIDSKFRGDSVFSTCRYSETIKVASKLEALEIIAEHLEYVESDPHLVDPEFTFVTNRKTGQIDRIVKSWTALT